jgi:predicted transcriptional regulator of viral defense system
VPHEIHIALPRGTKTPCINYPPIRVYRFTGKALTEGIRAVTLDGVKVNVYGPEKTVVDCFRFRNKIGVDVAIEALHRLLKKGKAKPADILHFARLCRVERVMRPYLEALL